MPAVGFGSQNEEKDAEVVKKKNKTTLRGLIRIVLAGATTKICRGGPSTEP